MILSRRLDLPQDWKFHGIFHTAALLFIEAANVSNINSGYLGVFLLLTMFVICLTVGAGPVRRVASLFPFLRSFTVGTWAVREGNVIRLVPYGNEKPQCAEAAQRRHSPERRPSVHRRLQQIRTHQGVDILRLK